MHRRSINRLLIALFLLTTLTPAHYHLHHLADRDSAAHDHAIDLHFVTVNVDASHHDEDTSIFAATPDVIVKKDTVPVFPYLLLTVLLVLVTQSGRSVFRPEDPENRTGNHYPYFKPPLRAPPLATPR